MKILTFPTHQTIDWRKPIISTDNTKHFPKNSLLFGGPRRDDVTIQFNKNNLALIQAARSQKLPDIERALEQGANPDFRDKNSETALHILAASDNLTGISKLLNAGADVNAFANEQITPLITAILAGQTDVVKLLLSNKANPYQAAVAGMTPLHFAALSGQPVMVQELLKLHADVNTQTDFGERPLHLAIKKYDALKQQNPAPNSEKAQQYALIKTLLKAKADPYLRDNDHISSLELAQSPELHLLLKDVLKTYYSAEWSPDEVAMDCFQHFKNLNDLDPQKIDSLLMEECAEQIGDYIRCEIQANSGLATEKGFKVRLFQQFKNAETAKSAKQIDFWNKVSQKAFEHTVIELAAQGIEDLDSVIGMNQLVEQLREDVVHRYNMIKNPHQYALPDGSPCPAKLPPPSGILFYGLPGTGKSYIARKLGKELDMNVVPKKLSDFMSTYKSGGVKQSAEIFQSCHELSTKTKKPTMLIIDEFDRLVQERSQLNSENQYKADEVAQLLQELETAQQRGILVVGTCNHAETMDQAIRSKRIDLRYEVLPPNIEGRMSLIRKFSAKYYSNRLENLPMSEIKAIATKTKGFTTAELETLTEKAVEIAARSRTLLAPQHFEQALPRIHRSLSPKDLERYSID